MNVTEDMSVLELVGAIAGKENSDDVARPLATGALKFATGHPDCLPEFIEDLSVGLSIEDPYRSGLVAWVLGCLIELGHAEHRSGALVMDWAKRALTLAINLHVAACAELPLGELSTVEDVRRKISELAPIFPLEARAWHMLKPFYPAIATPLRLFPALRKELLRLEPDLARLASHYPEIHHVHGLIQMPHGEPFLILDPERQRGLDVTVSDVESNFQLMAIVCDAFATTFRDTDFAVGDATRELATSPSPPSSAPPQSGRLVTDVMAFGWAAVRADSGLPGGKDDWFCDAYGRHRIFIEHYPWNIERRLGRRIMILSRSPLQMAHCWGRNYPGLSPAIAVRQVLDAATTTTWLQRFSSLARIEGMSPQTQVEARRDVLAPRLGERWRIAYLCRAVRRMLPYIQQHWGEHPIAYLAAMHRVLCLIEQRVIFRRDVDGKLAESLAASLLDYSQRAYRGRLAGSTLVAFADSVWQLADGTFGFQPPDHKQVLDLVAVIWDQAARKAGASGDDVDRDVLWDALLADMEMLRGLDPDAPLSPAEAGRLGNFWPAGRPAWWPLLPEYALGSYDYEVAISFSGEDRDVAERLAAALRLRGCRIFYDDFQRAELFGRALTPLLESVFRTRAMLCVVLISESYTVRRWPQLEWQVIRARFESDPACLLPLRLDDSKLAGLPDEIVFLPLRGALLETAVESVAARVEARMSSQLVL